MDAFRLAWEIDGWLRTFVINWPAKGEDSSEQELQTKARDKRAVSEFQDKFAPPIEALHERAKEIGVLDSEVNHYNQPRDYAAAQGYPRLLRDWGSMSLRLNAQF